jgi:hypothetical protein
MILIADSSALIALSICHSLDLLEPLFGKVQVPQAVFDEVTVSQKSESIGLAGYLKGKVKAVETNRYVYLDAYADAGETEAMILYKQIDADWLLIILWGKIDNYVYHHFDGRKYIFDSDGRQLKGISDIKESRATISIK